MLPTIESYSLPCGSELPPNRVDWRIDPNRAAFLIHDMQQYFVDAFGPDSSMVSQVVSNIRDLRSAAEAAGIPVYFTAQPPSQQPQQRGLLWDFWGPGIQDDGRHQIIDELSPTAADTALTKWRYDAFARSDFAEQLAASGRDQLVIAGVYAHIGCLTTAVSAFMQDIRPFLIADAVADFSYDDHLATLDYISRRCGMVVDTATALEQLTGTSAEAVRVDGSAR